MSVSGKSRWEWEYKTFCDFGRFGRKSEISRHYSKEAAEKAFKKLKKVYSPESLFPDRVLYRCWQEDRAGTIVNDTGAVIYS